MKNKPILIESSKASTNLSVVLVWLLVILLPSMAGKLLLFTAIDMDQSLFLSRLRQQLTIESNKHLIALSPDTFMGKCLEESDLIEQSNRILNRKLDEKKFNQHYLLKNRPKFKENLRAEIEKFSRFLKSLVGTEPDAILFLSQNPAECIWKLKKTLKLSVSDEKYRDILLFNGVRGIFRNFLYPETANVEYGLFTKEILNFYNPVGRLKTSISGLQTNFSLAANDEVFFQILPIPDFENKRDHRLVIFTYTKRSLSPEVILESSLEQLSKGSFRHRPVWSNESLLPIYEQNEDRLSLISDFPEIFGKLLPPTAKRKNRMAIEVSCSTDSGASKKKRLVNFAIKLYIMTTLLMLSGYFLGRFGINQSIQKMVSAVFFIGLLFPISGSGWMGIAFLNFQNQSKTESVMDFMEMKMFEMQKEVRQQISRNQLFYNFFARLMVSFDDKGKVALRNRLKFVTNFSRINENYREKPAIGRKFFTYLTIDNKNSEHFGFVNKNLAMSETIQPILDSPMRDVFLKLKAFKEISSDELNRIRQRVDLNLSVIEMVLDLPMISRIFANEQSYSPNRMAPRKEYVSFNIVKEKQKILGMVAVQHERSNWFHNLLDMLSAKVIQSIYFFKGFEIRTNLYPINPFNKRELRTSRDDFSNMESKENLEIAQAYYNSANSTRADNSDASPPNLVVTSVLGNDEIFILCRATPTSAKNSYKNLFALGGIILITLLSGLALANGTAKILLASIPPFQKAMHELENRNFHWNIALNSGDEFDSLAESFNGMAEKLIEKERLSKLVSRNVLDAISSTDATMLKPGGSKVNATILFSDIRSFTTITEKHTPEAVVEMLNDYFSVMTEIIEKHGGVIDKLIGDAIQAVFYEHEMENSSRNAILAGIEMREALKGLNQQRMNEGLFEVDNGVGICTGPLICGRVGSEEGKLDATVIGKVVNKAANLEAKSKYGKSSKILIDTETAQKAGNAYKTVELKIENDDQIYLEIVTG